MALDEQDRTESLAQVFVVAKYTTSREYGGPEEGGWWYTEETFDKVITAHTYEARAFRAVQNLNLQRDDNPDGGFHYRVIELPRWDDDPTDESCHLDPDQRPEPKLRFDIPVRLPRHRPHYC